MVGRTGRIVGAVRGACDLSLVGVYGTRAVLGRGKSRERLAGACEEVTREGVTDLRAVVGAAPCGRSLEAERGARDVWI